MSLSLRPNRESPGIPTLEAYKNKLEDPKYLPKEQEIIDCMKKSQINFTLLWTNEENKIFEFFNQEYIKALGGYLTDRVKNLGISGRKPVILEVGAGNGKLSYFLKQELGDSVDMVACDSGKWDIKPIFPVEKMDHKEALEIHKPDIVVFSWMPIDYDCTDDFRACPSVKEYLLIGSGEFCGNEETWKNNRSDFEKNYLKEVSKNQICRVDYIKKEDGEVSRHSYTTSFRRN